MQGSSIWASQHNMTKPWTSSPAAVASGAEPGDNDLDPVGMGRTGQGASYGGLVLGIVDPADKGFPAGEHLLEDPSGTGWPPVAMAQPLSITSTFSRIRWDRASISPMWPAARNA
jgi:hypothetical protein